MAKPFRGKINVDMRDWVADWALHLHPDAPPNAPNIVYIVLNDVELSAMLWGCLIETPNVNRLAARGLV